MKCITLALVFMLAACGPKTLTAQQADATVTQYLAGQVDTSENTKIQGTVLADLDGDQKPEIVSVWTLLGPTYWRNTLTVFSQTPDGYKQTGEYELIGEAKAPVVANGVISIDQILYAPGEPICCPTVHKTLNYRYAAGKITQQP